MTFLPVSVATKVASRSFQPVLRIFGRAGKDAKHSPDSVDHLDRYIRQPSGCFKQ
jgi:hypothetical protein